MESEIIRFAISHYRGQMSEVARRLKIGRSTLYRKLDEAAAERERQCRRGQLRPNGIVALWWRHCLKSAPGTLRTVACR